MSTRTNTPNTAVDAAIARIASDNASGAAEILRRAGTVFTILNAGLDFGSSEKDASDVQTAQQAVIDACVALALAQPEMSSLLMLASDALAAARNATGARQSLEAAQTAALNFVGNAERAARGAALHGAALIHDGATVLTHSRSSTVLAALVEAKQQGRDFSVVATESRPMLEGRALTEEIALHGISVTLIADAAASLLMNRVNLVLLGSDRITPVHVVNKIGTRMIALAARELDLPLYAISDSSKFIREDYVDGPTSATENPGELWKHAPRAVKVLNCYFEPTPLDFFTGVITESGALAVKDAKRLAEQASIDQALVDALKESRDRIK